MSTSSFVISLDFELFWGVSDSQEVAGYGRNVLGEWEAIPRMLDLFRRYGARVTWATVGMIMCRDYHQWRAIRPLAAPRYERCGIDPYRLDALVSEHPALFFARPLVEQILATPGQELATHTYSHFYCKEPGTTVAQFAADLACALALAEEMGVCFRSAVFPRNQVVEQYLDVLPEAGIQVYRGTLHHWLYRNGDAVAGGLLGRAVRYADAFVPLSGNGVVHALADGALVNLPASLFLYPWSGRYRGTATRLERLKRAMNAAARSGGVFHLWWHPHNFGANLEQNLAVLEALLEHYRGLAERYGMESRCMGDFAAPEAPAHCGAAQAMGPLQLRRETGSRP
ncbi:polysaccharide deacetylase family protein [Massilia sp. 9I]|uniref:polysaccharide deacetylase family protein n=1 Tax=Massilia sp. 9I TaxID=2653152 RepID=UPI0012F2F508|nr:polysaccharide deacetylase family protein [Massilia sp. 9I]VXB88935.1 conserved hypothetical protein [Massilia sp. 9I]